MEDQRIGSDTGSVYFTDVTRIVVGPHRTLYVVGAWDATQIQVIDSAGRLLRTIGGLGAGPGEFERVNDIGFLADTLWAIDEIRRRITLFPSFNEPATMQFVPPPVAGTLAEPELPSTILAGRVAAAIYRVGDRDGLETHHLILGLTSSQWRRLGVQLPESPRPGAEAAGVEWAIRDTIAMLSRENARIYTPVNMPGRDTPFRVIFAQPLADNPIWLAAPDGGSLVFIAREAPRSADSADFTATRVSARGDTLYSRAFRYRPIPTGDHLVDSVLRLDEDARLGMARDAVFAPPFRPPVTRGFIADDGSVWLRREFSYGSRTRWTIIDTDGHWAGDVEVASTHELHAADENFAWAVVSDSNGVPHIVRYRIVKGTVRL